MSREGELEAGAGPVAQRLAHAMARISEALRHTARRQAAVRGLTPTQGEILVWLGSHPNATLRELAQALAITPATASDAVKALAAKNLVRKRRSAGDARVLGLTLSARGRREAHLAAGWSGFLAQAAADLPAREQEWLLAALIRVIKVLQDAGRIPVARMCVTCAYFRPYVHPHPARPHHCDLVDAAFGDRLLRTDCAEYSPAAEPGRTQNWRTWSSFDHSEEATT